MNRQFVKNIVANGIILLVGVGLTLGTPLGWLGGLAMGLGVYGCLETLARSKPSGGKLARDASGASPVIGVILMVAITVVLAAIVFVLVSNLGDGVEQAPHIAVEADGRGNYTVIAVDSGVSYGDLLMGCGAGSSPPSLTPGPAPADGSVHGGDRLRCESGRLTILHRPTETVIYTDNHR